MGLKGQKGLMFWCLMPKGEKLRQKQMDQPITCEFQKNGRVRIFVFCPKSSYCKNWSLMGENFRYGKRGEFVVFDQIYS
jgi:hypothetical protein